MKINFNLKEQKEKIFIIIVLVITIFIGKKIFDSQNTKMTKAQSMIQDYQRSIEIAKEINSLDQQLSKFDNAGWQTQESVAIMGKINELASQYKVEVLNFDPGSQQDYKYYIILGMALNIKGDYFSLTNFLSAIENLESLTKVTELQIRPSRDINSKEYGSLLEASLKISAFIIKK